MQKTHRPECQHIHDSTMSPNHGQNPEALLLVFKVYFTITHTQVSQGGQHGLIDLDWQRATAERQWGGLVVNKGILRVNCPSSEWSPSLEHSHEQEKGHYFPVQSELPSVHHTARHVNTAEGEVQGVKVKFRGSWGTGQGLKSRTETCSTCSASLCAWSLSETFFMLGLGWFIESIFTKMMLFSQLGSNFPPLNFLLFYIFW